jgi:hypothetical protein
MHWIEVVLGGEDRGALNRMNEYDGDGRRD